MNKYRFERFVKGRLARLRHSDDDAAFVTASNVPGHLAFVEFVLDEDDPGRISNAKLVKDIIVPEKINVQFLERGLKVYRHGIKVKPFRSIVSKFVKSLRTRMALSIKVTTETVRKLCDLADGLEIKTDPLQWEAKEALKLLLQQMSPERTEKLRVILKHCPISEMGRYARTSTDVLDWNPDTQALTQPIDFLSVLSHIQRPGNDIQRGSLDIWQTLKATEMFLAASNSSKTDGLLALLRSESNRQSVDLLVRNGVARAFHLPQNKSVQWVTTPILFGHLEKIWRLSIAWNRFSFLDNWDKYLRGRENLVESCLVLCKDDCGQREVHQKVHDLVTVTTPWDGITALERLPCQPLTIIVYKFDLWTFEEMFYYLPLFESKRIKDVVSTKSCTTQPFQLADFNVSSKVIDLFHLGDGYR